MQRITMLVIFSILSFSSVATATCLADALAPPSRVNDARGRDQNKSTQSQASWGFKGLWNRFTSLLSRKNPAVSPDAEREKKYSYYIVETFRRLYSYTPPDFWQHHIEKSREAILQTITRVANHGRVLILGAGSANEIPLEVLAEKFNEVILVDLSISNLNNAKRKLPVHLQHKVKIRLLDITNDAVTTLLDKFQVLAKRNLSTSQLDKKLADLMMGTDTRPMVITGADLVISSVVLTDIYNASFAEILNVLKEKYGEPSTNFAHVFPLTAAAKEVFASRLRKQHIEIIAINLNTMGIAYLSSTEITFRNFQPSWDCDEFGRHFIAEFQPMTRTRHSHIPLEDALSSSFSFHRFDDWIWHLRSGRWKIPGLDIYHENYPVVKCVVEAFALQLIPRKPLGGTLSANGPWQAAL